MNKFLRLSLALCVLSASTPTHAMLRNLLTRAPLPRPVGCRLISGKVESTKTETELPELTSSTDQKKSAERSLLSSKSIIERSSAETLRHLLPDIWDKECNCPIRLKERDELLLLILKQEKKGREEQKTEKEQRSHKTEVREFTVKGLSGAVIGAGLLYWLLKPAPPISREEEVKNERLRL